MGDAGAVLYLGVPLGAMIFALMWLLYGLGDLRRMTERALQLV